MSDFHKPAGKSAADMHMREGFARMASMAVKATFTGIRNVISRGRLLEASVDWHQLPLKTSRSIVDTDGVFFFIPGLSTVGGGDRVRP